MDTFTHGIAGALVAKAFFTRDPRAGADPPGSPPFEEQRARNRLAVLAGMLAALFPDSDIFLDRFASSELASLELHRGVTHSFVCLPLWALLLAALVHGLARWRRAPAPPFRTLLLLNAAALASHIVLDLITAYGTIIWSPVSNHRAAWDLTFIIDFTFSAIVFAPLAAAWIYRRQRGGVTRAMFAWIVFALGAVGVEKLARDFGVEFSPWAVVVAALVFGLLFLAPLRRGWGFTVRGQTWARAGVAALGLYLLLCFAAQQTALARVKAFAAGRGIAVEHLGALPMPPSLLRWSGLIRATHGVYYSSFRLTDRQPPGFAFEADSPPNRYIAAARELPPTRTYLWFARFPVVRYAQEHGVHVVKFYDLRFGGGSIRRRRAPFTLRITLDHSGQLRSYGWAND